MFDNKTEKLIRESVISEYVNACKTYGEKYNSLHEGYAVLKEEIEEAKQELEYLEDHFTSFWNSIKIDDKASALADVRTVAFDAIRMAEEAVQVAAVVRKILGGAE